MAADKQRSALQRLNPINKMEEKRRFFFDVQYNPQFVYEKPISSAEFHKYGEVSAEYLKIGRSILDAVIGKWKTEVAFLEEVEGQPLSKEQFAVTVREYLKKYGMDQQVKITYSPNFVSPTSMQGNEMRVRLPISHRAKRILGTLDHEIGTHYFRRLNEDKQPWAGKREAFGLSPYLETEEGLAILHAHLSLPTPMLWFSALFYYAVYQASKLSFAELFADLRQYVTDKERRWNMCVRAKRGMTDTSQPGAIAKDQVYLRGTIKVLAWLREHEYDPRPLYWGKIALEDVEKAQRINPTFQPLVPEFLQDLKHYAKQVKKIEKENFLTDLT